MKYWLVLLVILFISCNLEYPGYSSLGDGLYYKIIEEGHGAAVEEGQTVLMHEATSYQNGFPIFNSRTLPRPLEIVVGGGMVVEGVDKGLVGMKIGEKRELIVPPELSKRSTLLTFPHPDSTLIYTIELLEITTR